MGQSDKITQGCKIGIYWAVNGELILKATMVCEVPPVEGIRDVDDAHYSYWTLLARTGRRDLIAYSYDHFPRGRVVYRETDKKFVIFGDRCVISNKKFINQLRKALGLSSKQCVVMSDGHYQCHQCNPLFISDPADFDDL